MRWLPAQIPPAIGTREGRAYFPPFTFYARRETSFAGQLAAAHLRFSAIQRYPLRRISIIPGILEIHTSGRPHQISRASATAASAPQYWLPSLSRNLISKSSRSRGIPSSSPTRGSCSGASAIPRRSRIGAIHRAVCTQNLHSASKNNHPRACRPSPSVYSHTSEIMASYPAAFVLLEPSNVITLQRNFTTPFSAPVGMRMISSNNPVIAVKNSSMLSSRSRVYASPCGFALTSRTHSASTFSVGSISRRLRSSETIRKISHTSLIDSKWSLRSPSTCTTRTILHPCSSRRLVLTFDRATASVSEISSAGSGTGDRNSNACTCATVLLMPQRVPISPQCKINFWATGVSEFFVGSLILAPSVGRVVLAAFVMSDISVVTEYTVL